MVLAPTRELAIQIHQDAVALGRHTQLRLGLVYGGVDYDKQRNMLREGIDVLIGTPGRIIDYFKQRVFDMREVEVVVLDEADRMFDLGFEPQITRILANIRPDRHARFPPCAPARAAVRPPPRLRRTSALALSAARRGCTEGGGCAHPERMLTGLSPAHVPSPLPAANLGARRQVALFSATFPRAVDALARALLVKPLQIIGASIAPARGARPLRTLRLPALRAAPLALLRPPRRYAGSSHARPSPARPPPLRPPRSPPARSAACCPPPLRPSLRGSRRRFGGQFDN